MANLTPEEVQKFETAPPTDAHQTYQKILYVLGLSPDTLDIEARKKKRGLWMAAKTSSISYKREMTDNELLLALISGNIPIEIASNLRHFLDEAPIAVVVMAVEEAAIETDARIEIWRNIASMAIKMHAHRADIFK